MNVCGVVFWGVVRVVVALVTCGALIYAQMPAPGTVLRAQPGVPRGVEMQDTQDASVEIGLHITVLAGQNAVNVVKKRAAVRPVIEVRDRTDHPVEGASVTFTAPNDNPSAVFTNDSRLETVVTDRTGEATVGSMKPEGAGQFALRVTASFQGDRAAATITQTNVMTAGEAAHTGARGEVATTATSGMSNKTVIGIVAGVAAAAAVGIGVGLASGGKSGSTSSVGVGTPTVGAPH